MRRKTNMRPRYPRWQDDLRPAKPVREATNKILEMIDEGLLDSKDVVLMALKWMSEDDVKAMAEANELFKEDTEDEED
jgi:hypothetical protein